MKQLTLDQLLIGKKAIVSKLLPESAPFRRKLLAMGITPGCPVSMIRIAPLGDPIEIQMRGFFLFLRKSEAETISIIEVENE